MRLLFIIDKKNYKEDGTIFKRPSARGIIIKDNKLGMVHSLKYDYYKFPGGGINNNENHLEALIREIKEEVGLIVKEDSIKEYGCVIRKEKGEHADIFLQENYYYLCDIKDYKISQKLDDYEDEEGFTLEWVTADHAIETNKNHDHHNYYMPTLIEREIKVLEMLKEEKYLE